MKLEINKKTNTNTILRLTLRDTASESNQVRPELCILFLSMFIQAIIGVERTQNCQD